MDFTCTHLYIYTNLFGAVLLNVTKRNSMQINALRLLISNKNCYLQIHDKFMYIKSQWQGIPYQFLFTIISSEY